MGGGERNSESRARLLQGIEVWDDVETRDGSAVMPTKVLGGTPKMAPETGALPRAGSRRVGFGNFFPGIFIFRVYRDYAGFIVIIW